MPSGTVVSTPANGSSNPVPNAHWPSPPCAWSSASYTVSSCMTRLSCVVGGRSPSVLYRHEARVVSRAKARWSHVGDVLGDLVEGRVPVDLVPARGEHRVLLVRAG